jgi:predicted phosphoribosyltransferase
MVFASREEAGRRLGIRLQQLGVTAHIVLGLPRGGVVVAAQVAQVLGLPLDVLVVRKIGHPLHREYALGALAEHGVVILDDVAIERTVASPSAVEAVVEEETQRLHAYESRFHRAPRGSLAGQRVLLVDDGLATGSTMEAAVYSVKTQSVASVRVAVPVASVNAAERIAPQVDDVIALSIDPEFEAVGRYYESFAQNTDQQVLDLLEAG